MTITAKIIADSLSPSGKRLTTVQLEYPRFIHAEFMTHRVFSRNASSSRAIPVAKMIQQVRTNPAMPLKFMKNQPGMQSTEEYGEITHELIRRQWLESANIAADQAEKMTALYDVHKQFTNRLLEPFQHIQVVVTATEWDNFFLLRDHKDAQPEIHELAIQMKKAMNTSLPCMLASGEWHLPYVTEYERTDGYWKGRETDLCKISAARCARVSYLLHDGAIPNIDKDMALYERLIESEPMHASPIEHQAMPDRYVKLFIGDESGNMDQIEDWAKPGLHGNFVGWCQFRKFVEKGLL